jgi:hypothetical protein
MFHGASVTDSVVVVHAVVSIDSVEKVLVREVDTLVVVVLVLDVNIVVLVGIVVVADATVRVLTLVDCVDV